MFLKLAFDDRHLRSVNHLNTVAAAYDSRRAAFFQKRVGYKSGVFHRDPEARGASVDIFNIFAPAKTAQDDRRGAFPPHEGSGRSFC